MRLARVTTAAVAVGLAACAGTMVRQYGDYTAFAPKVSAPNDQRRPEKVTVQLEKPANVAVFLVTPGRTPTLLFPADSNQSAFVQAGTHELTTSRPPAVTDSSRIVPRRGQEQQTRGGIGQRSARDSAMMMGRRENRFAETSYLLVYASEEPLSYKALSTRVQGLTIPAVENEALNTVTKLIRATQQGTGAWAAWATEF